MLITLSYPFSKTYLDGPLPLPRVLVVVEPHQLPLGVPLVI